MPQRSFDFELYHTENCQPHQYRAGVVDDRMVVMLFLIVERMRGSDSAWAPWIAALPQTFSTPLFFGKAELAQLAGTTLYHATQCAQIFHTKAC